MPQEDLDAMLKDLRQSSAWWTLLLAARAIAKTNAHIKEPINATE